MIKFVIIAIISYLLGSLNFGVIISRKFQKDDVRTHGSGNAGATNMVRSYGKIWGVITILGDMAKVAVAIVIALWLDARFNATLLSSVDNNALINDWNIFIKSFAGFFCVLGHIFPCFFGFKGGKGVATCGGMVFMIDWRIALILLAMFFVVLIVTRYVSLGSLVMAFFYPIFIGIFYKNVALIIIAIIFASIVFIAHRSNINSLINHTERKMSFLKNKDK